MATQHFLDPLLSKTAGGAHRLVLAGGVTLAHHVDTAFDALTRKRGLLDHASLAPDRAMIIAPCSAVHTFGMRFPIDVIFAARDGRVMKIVRALGPRRMTAAWRAFAAIEMAAGEATRHEVGVGDYVRVTAAGQAG